MRSSICFLGRTWSIIHWLNNRHFSSRSIWRPAVARPARHGQRICFLNSILLLSRHHRTRTVRTVWTQEHHHLNLSMRFPLLFSNRTFWQRRHRHWPPVGKREANNYTGRITINSLSACFRFGFVLSVCQSIGFLSFLRRRLFFSLVYNWKTSTPIFPLSSSSLLFILFLIHSWKYYSLQYFLSCFVFYLWLGRFVSFSFDIVLFLNNTKLDLYIYTYIEINNREMSPQSSRTDLYFLSPETDAAEWLMPPSYPAEC